MASPVVSVIIPVFNLEAFLREAVDSVLAQSFTDFELLLVDDGSTDGSRELIAVYRQRYPGRVQALLQAHRGAAAARNAGIAVARGEWIAFLDGDDAWRPAKLEAQLRLAAADPRCNFVASAVEIHGQGRPWLPPPEVAPDLKVELLRRGCFITLSSVLLRHELLAQVRFDESLEGAQDFELFLRIADDAHLAVAPAPLVLYRLREGAISDLSTTRYLQAHSHFQVASREVRRLLREQPLRLGPHLPEVRRALRRLAHEAAYSALMSRRAELAMRVRLAAVAIASDPPRLKNYRLLLQALLPAAVNAGLARRRAAARPGL
ncbi:MAG: glycosyltransferase [Acidobacteriota bacterium]